MNILYEMLETENNHIGCRYVWESKDYYIDISCENEQSSDVINDLLVNEKKSLSKEYIKHRLDTLELCYTPWIITNRPFYFKKGRAINLS